MRINLSIFHSCICWDQTAAAATKPKEIVAPISFASFNLCEEYASAFRTESYNEFWARVVELTFLKGSTTPPTPLPKSKDQARRNIPTRLPSYHHFADSLLDPDPATVAQVLAAHARSNDDSRNQLLLADYFTETANASLVCASLLKDVERVRARVHPIRTALNSDADSDGKAAALLFRHLADLSNCANPFGPESPSQHQFRAVQAGSAQLLKQLDSGRKKARARVRLASRLKRALAVALVVLTVSTSAIGLYVALHAFVALAALPAVFPAWVQTVSTRWLGRALARLDAAAKGAYILNRDLDTISRLVSRLQDEVEHMLATLRFCCGRARLQRPTKEMVRQLRKNDASFNQQLDELEEHLFLCFMTINKARSLVVKEVSAP